MRLVRVLWIGTLCLCLGLTACSGGSPGPPQKPLAGRSGNYSTQAVIHCRELNAVAAISQETPEACTVSFDSPDSLRGMTFVFRRDSVDVGYKGLSFPFDPRSVPGGAIAGAAVSAVNKAMRDDEIAVNQADRGIELTGMLDVGEFSLWIDPQSGSLMKLLIPSEELEIEFQNFLFLD